MAGYTRQSLAQILNGEIVSAPPLNAEFNQILAAFNNSTGHKHDGTAAEGPPIDRIADLDQNNLIFVDTSANQINFYVEFSAAPVGQISIQDGAILPFTDNDIDLGSSSFEFKDLYIDGTANIDSLVADTADINAGTIDNTVIGATTPAAGTFTNLTVSTGSTIDFTGATVSNGGTFTTVTISGGSITGITDLAIADGGTGASTASAARTNLGLAIGTNVQAYDAGLQSISGLTTSANQMLYTTASDTYATTSLTSAGRALLDDADASAQRTTLGLGTIATQNANNVAITGGTISGISNLSDIGNALPYTFSTTTTDSDPGSGVLRLNNATQNTATEIYIDDEEANAADVSAFIQLLSGGNNPSSVLGTITLRKEFNPESFLQFKVTGVTNASGYTKLTIINTSSSTANPFSNSDNVFLDISLSGDKGDTGDVTGPASSTDNAIVRWDGTSGGLVQDSGVTIDDSGTITAAQYDSTESLPDIKPSLNLDFANVKKLDPRITYTRASTGTYYDGKTFAKAEENLLLQSQAWATSPWANNAFGSGNVVVNNADTAPDGTTTATSLTFGAQYATREQSVTTLDGQSYTFSFWAKNINGNTALKIIHFASATGNDTAVTIDGTWTRYSVTVLGKSGGGAVFFGIQDANASGQGETLFWGAQLEQRSSVTDYTPTTTQPITNYIPALQTAASGVARFDHDPITSESLGFLIEEQRTNLLTYSEDFSNAAWTKTQSSLTSNIVVAPDGTLTGDKIVEDTSASAIHIWYQTATTTANTQHTLTLYAKAAERSYIQLQLDDTTSNALNVSFDLSDGSISTAAGNGGTASGATASSTAVGNGWYRLTLSGIPFTSGTTIRALFYIKNDSNSATYTGDGYSGVYIWGAQLEAGAFPTSYIKTTTAQTTRNADAASMTGTNFSEWYNAGKGTVYCESSTVDFSSNKGIWAIGNPSLAFSSGNMQYETYTASFSGRRTLGIFFNGSSQASSLGTFVAQSENTFSQGAFAYALNDLGQSTSGATAGTDADALIPIGVTGLSIGGLQQGWSGAGNYLNGHIRKLSYYPQRLSNATLQALTEE